MTRRWALAASLVLTVFVGFFVLTYGTNAGVFAWSGAGGATQSPTIIGASPAEQLPAQEPAVIPAAPAADFVNIDQATLQPSDQPAASDRREHEGDDDGDDRDHNGGEHERDD